MRETFTLTEDAGDFQALGRAALVFCSRFQLVLRRSPRAARVLDALERLRPFLEDSTEQSEWPGTRLLRGKATVNTYRLDPSSLELLLKLGATFCDWVDPELPEDLCFRRADGSVWLGSVAHEGDVFLKLSADELAALGTLVPRIIDRLSKDQKT